MKKIAIVVAGLALAACSQSDKRHAETAARPDAMSAELAAMKSLVADVSALKVQIEKKPQPIRWAFANKSQISTVTAEWTRRKVEEAQKTESLSPEMQAKLDEFEQVNAEMRQLNLDAMRRRTTPGFSQESVTSNPAYPAIQKRLQEARRPVAAILERRSQLQSQSQYPVDTLIAEYARDRFDLILDSTFGNQSILFRTATETPDITEGVIRFFRQKEKLP